MSVAQSASASGSEVLRASGLIDAPAPFVGRRAELALLREEIGRPGLRPSARTDRTDRVDRTDRTDRADRAEEAAAPARVLVVAGRPGSGRTALALRLAAELVDGFPVAVRLSLRDPFPARRLLDALGLPRPAALSPDEAESAAAEAVRAHLAEQQVLLVLDDVTGSGQIQPLLPTAPGSLVLAVTSGPLSSVPDARPCVLGGLDYTAARELLAAMAGDVRVVNDPVAAQAMAETVACHAGALRLLGGWLATRPRASLSDALQALRDVAPEAFAQYTRPQAPSAPAPSERPSVLGLPGQAVPPMPSYAPTVGAPAAAPPPPRGAQRSEDPLRRTFALVYGALGGGAQQLLRLTTVVPGGVLDARGAAALVGCPVDAAATQLASLAAQQLLHEEAAAPGRFRVPESLRPVLTGLREAHDKPAAVELSRARWLERQVRLLGACVHRLAPDRMPEPEPLPVPLRFRSAAEAWAWLDLELPTLLLAVPDAMAAGGLDGLVTRLATALVRALPVWGEARGRSVATDLYALHSAVQELARRGAQPQRQAAALVNLGDLHAAAGEHSRAMERYRSALGPARAAQDQVAVGRILEATAGAYRASGDLVRAVDFYGRALTLRRNRGERADEARLLGRLAATHSAQGRYTDALREYRAAVALHRKLDDESAAVTAILGAARVQELSGGTEAALRTQREALEAARRAGGGRLEGLVLLRMAEALDRAGDQAGARVQRDQAAALGVGRPRQAPTREHRPPTAQRSGFD
ncbi:tetratricopeptide repeat protein [Streptacidiphilus fuscans]|uniref:Tetratricopeptide repeat protein n=1 Tax=Streptacidiphilus fuscans TaxID=2789292 RepID=A0A931B9L2_9ACTN|nr:tetratricopeptide repeat protein [Streptacidiphilus fuscans]MBF9071157.1 tetratricopeptide repeat protein [Streptacidiphilus fuscans]